MRFSKHILGIAGWIFAAIAVCLIGIFKVYETGNSFDYSGVGSLYLDLESSSVEKGASVEAEIIELIPNEVTGQEVWIAEDMVVLGLVESFEVGDIVDFNITDARKIFGFWYIIVE